MSGGINRIHLTQLSLSTELYYYQIHGTYCPLTTSKTDSTELPFIHMQLNEYNFMLIM